MALDRKLQPEQDPRKVRPARAVKVQEEGASTVGSSSARTLQQRLGNQGTHGVASLLVSRPGGQSTLQRQSVIDNPPLMIGKTAKSSDRMQKIANELWERYPSLASQFISDWVSEAGQAVNSLADPADPELSTYWWIALGGNVVWALSTLAPLLGQVALGVAGAVVGSGAAQKTELLGPPLPASKPLLIQHLAETGDKIEKAVRPILEDALTEAAAKNITSPTEQNKVLWRHMFPSIPYDTRRGVITNTARAAALSAFDDFVKQYEAWKNMIRNTVDEERLRNYRSAGDLGEAGGRAGYFLRATSDSEWAAAANRHPFKPKLKFKGF